LCDQEAQINSFKASTDYKKFFGVHDQTCRQTSEWKFIQDVVATYFRCVMLSHRWEGKEPLLHDIQDKVVYVLDQVGGILKLQSFCEVARDAWYTLAWTDTCCTDQSNNDELYESVNSVLIWYRHLALTIVYLSDIPPFSKSGALAKSAWNPRGWTVQEFLAPRLVLFYQQDWTP
jgi:hypothetical protein